MTPRHQAVLIQYQSKCFPLVVLVFVRECAKGSPLPRRGVWGQRAVGESQGPSQRCECSPSTPVLSQEHQPHRSGETQHCESPEMWLYGSCTDWLGDSLS